MNALTQPTPPVARTTNLEAAPYWGAQLRLAVSRDKQRSYLSTASHEGPLRIQRPFYPEGTDLCHLYLLHPPGGLVSGDHLQISLQNGKGARALVTTPSAGRVYRANERGTAQTQTTRLTVEQDGSLEWLPQETIIFDKASAVLETEIHLDPTARLVAWEMVCLGRPHSNELFKTGSLRQRFSVWSNGIPLYLDYFALNGNDLTKDAVWGLQGLNCVGTMVVGCGDMAISEINQLVERLRESQPAGGDLHFGVTRLRSLIVIRLLGNDSETAKALLNELWATLRPALLGREASIPRIWNT